MHNETYIWLGSRRARRKQANEAAVHLDLARNARLPVPAGIVLLDEAWHYARRQEWVTINGSHVQFKAPDFARELIMAASFDRPVHLTPTRLPIQPDLSPYHSLIQQPDEFANAVASAWSQMLSFQRQAGDRLDILLTETVSSTRQGSAASAAGYPVDLVWEAPDFECLSVPQLEKGGLPSQDPVFGRLQQLLRGVRRSLGDANWLVEWGDDGRTAWLLRLWTLPPHWQRQDQYLPWLSRTDLPADFAAQAASIWAEEIGPTHGRQPVRVQAGQVELNLSLLADFWQGLGLPGEWVPDQGRFVCRGTGRLSIWRHPHLYARSLYWRSRLTAWLDQESSKTHSQRILALLAVRALCRIQIAGLTGKPAASLPTLGQKLRIS